MLNLSVKNLLMVTAMAVLGIIILKVVFTKYPVAGVTDVVNAV